MTRSAAHDIRRRVHALLDHGPASRVGRILDRALVGLIVVNLVAVALESVPALARDYHVLFASIEYVALAVFSSEYGLRIWVAGEHGPHRHLTPFRARLKYMLSPEGLVDFVAVLPFWFAPLLPDDLRMLQVLRIFRFFKIARYSPAMRSLLDVLYRERRALFGCIVITVGAALVSAALMHLAEGHVQPDKLGTIPDALWWAIVTVGTIGYGDVVPVTTVGKLIATGTIFLGLIMMALPVGIIAKGFADQFHRRGRGRGLAAAHACAARNGAVLRRGERAAARAPLGDGDRADAHQSARSRRAGPARADAARFTHRAPDQGGRQKSRRPRSRQPEGRHRDGRDRVASQRLPKENGRDEPGHSMFVAALTAYAIAFFKFSSIL